MEDPPSQNHPIHLICEDSRLLSQQATSRRASEEFNRKEESLSLDPAGGGEQWHPLV
jgi:hypothetical protein